MSDHTVTPVSRQAGGPGCSSTYQTSKFFWGPPEFALTIERNVKKQAHSSSDKDILSFVYSLHKSVNSAFSVESQSSGTQPKSLSKHAKKGFGLLSRLLNSNAFTGVAQSNYEQQSNDNFLPVTKEDVCQFIERKSGDDVAPHTRMMQLLSDPLQFCVCFSADTFSKNEISNFIEALGGLSQCSGAIRSACAFCRWFVSHSPDHLPLEPEKGDATWRSVVNYCVLLLELDFSSFPTVLNSILFALSTLATKKQIADAIVLTFQSYSQDHLTRLVERLRDLLSEANSDVSTQLHAEWSSLARARVLELMYEADNGRKDEHIPLPSFSALSSVPIKPLFLRDRHHPMLFSYTHFPRFLEKRDKPILFRLLSMQEMLHQVQKTFLNQAWATRSEERLRHFDKNNRLRDFCASVRRINSIYLVLRVRRAFIINDTLRELAMAGNCLTKPLKVVFEGEEGMDIGGVQKEFFQLLMNNFFNPDNGLFTIDPDSRLCWFNESTIHGPEAYGFLGLCVGLALFNGVPLALPLPALMFRYLCCDVTEDHASQTNSPKHPSIPLSLSDLAEISPILAQSLLLLLSFDGDVEDVFQCNFEISRNRFDTVETVELVPGGSHISVTSENREEYVNLYVQHLLWSSVSKSVTNFIHGFQKVFRFDRRMLSMMHSSELHALLCASVDPHLDLSPWEAIALYDGYQANSTQIQWLWQTVHQFDEDLKHRFVAFVTGSDRVPILGLSSLSLTITRHGPDSELLPSAMTCFNRFFLPEYNSQEKLEKKLIQALNNTEGFLLV